MMPLSKILAAMALCFTTKVCFGHQRVFSIHDWIEVPDGTLVAPFLNSKDCTSKLPWDLLNDVSIAAGEIKHDSSIQTLPLVTQITFVLSGRLEVLLKEEVCEFPTCLLVETNQAVLMKPGSLFQLRNYGEEPCKVLYIVSPAYLFELDETGLVIYDDAFIVSENWEELKFNEWKPFDLPSLESKKIARDESSRRLAAKKT